MSSKLPSLAVVSKQRAIQHAWRLLLLPLHRVVFFTLLRFIRLRIIQQVTYLSILARASPLEEADDGIRESRP